MAMILIIPLWYLLTNQVLKILLKKQRRTEKAINKDTRGVNIWRQVQRYVIEKSEEERRILLKFGRQGDTWYHAIQQCFSTTVASNKEAFSKPATAANTWTAVQTTKCSTSEESRKELER